MFRKLLFGDEAKLAFKTSTTSGIARLYTQPTIPPTEHRYWRAFLSTFDSPAEAFSLLSVADVRRALASCPENIETLTTTLVLHLESLRADPLFTPLPSRAKAGSAAGGSGTSTVASWIPGAGSNRNAGPLADGRDRVKEALNCIRILTRILPVIMEGDHDASCDPQAEGAQDSSASLQTHDLEHRLLWSSVKLPGTNEGEARGEEQFVIDDEEDEQERGGAKKEATSSSAAAAAAGPSESEELGPSLGERLLTLIVELLFYSGFTMPWTEEQLSSADEMTERVHYSIWERGVGSSVDLVGVSKVHEANRVEVLRLLLVLLSRTIYVPAASQLSTENPAAHFVATGMERSVVLPLLCSLLNTSLRQDKAGWLGGLASLPGGGPAPEESRPALVGICLQMLAVLLSYEPVVSDAEVEAQGSQQSTPLRRPRLGTAASSSSISSAHLPAAGTSTVASSATSGGAKARPPNLFRFYVSKLHRTSDFELVWNGLSSILSARMEAAGGLMGLPNPAVSIPLPGSPAGSEQGPGQHTPEAMVLLWRFASHNARFRTFLVDDAKRAPGLMATLLFHALENRFSLPQQGLVRLSVFVLQDLSAERAFGAQICKPGSGAAARIPNASKHGVATGGGHSIAGTGSGPQAPTAADVLIQSVYGLIATTRGSLTSLYAPLVLSLANTAPFWSNLSITSANRLASLLSSFSSPHFLLADEGNPRLIFYLLEALTAVVRSSYAQNANLVYALLRNLDGVRRLGRMTLRGGIADIRRARRKASGPRNGGRARTGLAARLRSAAAPNAGGAAAAPGASQVGGEALLSPAQERSTNPLNADEEKARLAQRDAQANATAAAASQEGNGDDAAAAAAEGAEDPSDKVRGKMRKLSVSSSSAGTTTTAEGVTTPGLAAASELPPLPEPASTAEGGKGEADEEEDEEEAWAKSLSEGELWEAAATIGRHGFVPTEDWVRSWAPNLPVQSLTAALETLVPRVEDFVTEAKVGSKADADDRILAFLREQDLSEVLPKEAPALHARPFRWNDQVTIWLLSYLWGFIYVSHMHPYGLWASSNARLFHVHVQERREAPNRGEQALVNASNAVVGALSGVWGAIGGAAASVPLPAPPGSSRRSTSRSGNNGAAAAVAARRSSASIEARRSTQQP